MDEKKYRVFIEFCKKDKMIYISHLDLMRLFARIFRKINLPLAYSKGYNPKPKLSFTRALALGVKSDRETMYIYLSKKVNLKQTRHRLNILLPKGITVNKIMYSDKESNKK